MIINSHKLIINKVHVDNVKEVIKKPNASIVLTELLKGKKKMTELQEKVKNYASLKLLILNLEREGYVKIEEPEEGKKVIYVSLTEKGRAVAEKLKEAERVAKLSDEELEKFRNLHALEHFNVYEDHVTLTDISMEGVRYVNIYARTRGETVYFYCEMHDSDDCYHVGYLFFDEKLRSFVKEWIEKNGYKLAKKYDKYVEKYW